MFFLTELQEEVQYLGLGWSHPAVVGLSAISIEGSAGEGHGYHHPLAHAAGKLVGIGVVRLPGLGIPTGSSSSIALSFASALSCSVGAGSPRDLVADAEHRAERGHGLLKIIAISPPRISRMAASSSARRFSPL